MIFFLDNFDVNFLHVNSFVSALYYYYYYYIFVSDYLSRYTLVVKLSPLWFLYSEPRDNR